MLIQHRIGEFWYAICVLETMSDGRQEKIARPIQGLPKSSVYWAACDWPQVVPPRATSQSRSSSIVLSFSCSSPFQSLLQQPFLRLHIDLLSSQSPRDISFSLKASLQPLPGLNPSKWARTTALLKVSALSFTSKHSSAAASPRLFLPCHDW